MKQFSWLMYHPPRQGIPAPTTLSAPPRADEELRIPIAIPTSPEVTSNRSPTGDVPRSMRVLLADDEPKVAQHLCQGLTAEGYAVDTARDGDEALWQAENNPYDVLLLDVMMPGRDGFSVVRRLRHKQILVPVIFITARGEVEDRVRGLDAGGDDYLVKPFSLSELLARIRAMLRRQRPQCFNVLRVADLELDLLTHRATRGGLDIELTNREFALLEFLMVSSPKLVSRAALVEHVWDQHFDSETNVVSVYIKILRRKIDLPGLRPLIHTSRGVGYALREEKP